MTEAGLRLARIRVAAAAAILLIAGSTSTAAIQSQRTRSERSYSSLSDIPPTLGERLPCREEEGDECATRVRLLTPLTVWGVPLAAGTIATDWEEDRNGTLARNFRYKGVWLKGGTRISLYTGWSGTLLRDHVLRGIPCRGGTGVAFYDDGKLAECTLSRHHAIQGVTYPAGTVLRFDVDGRRIAPAP